MLRSVTEERSRRFRLALRAGVPILLLVSILFYFVFSKDTLANPSLVDIFIAGGLIFVSIYFIYFLLELDSKETVLDQITQSYNHDSFLAKIRKHHPKTIALLRINNLSSINENYGTKATNGLLQTLVFKLDNYMQKSKIEKSWIGRNFGAEFLIAADTESSLIDKILKQFTFDNKSLENIDIDYKYAIIDNNDTEPDKLITLLRDSLVSQRLSPNKKTKNVRNSGELNTLEKSTIAALEKESLSISFRPQLNIKRDKIDTYEIASKLISENGKDIQPRDFLPIVNRLGLGRLYDLSLFKKIVKIAKLCDEDISFSFNLSPFSLRDQEFREKIFKIIEDEKVNPGRLIIELYERKTYHDLSNYLKTLKEIRARGFQVCIDNFGSSSASLEYMKNFSFDRVKFDRDYVIKLDNPKNVSILKSMIEMSKDLNIITIAKWVDNEEQIKILKRSGIDYLQGFAIGKKLNEDQFIRHHND